MAVTENYITAGRLTATGYTMIAITTFFCLARFVLRFWKSAGFQVEDAFVLLSWIFFLVLAIDYIVVTPVMYRVTEIEAGRAPPYPTLEKDALFMIKIFFTNTMLLWAALWSVKLSLLFLYRRLLKGLPDQLRWWWGIFLFTIVVYLLILVMIFSLLKYDRVTARLLSAVWSPISPPAAVCTPGSPLVRGPKLNTSSLFTRLSTSCSLKATGALQASAQPTMTLSRK